MSPKRYRIGLMVSENLRSFRLAALLDPALERLLTLNVPLRPVPVSSRGQDTWFSATGPGFESPYRYQPSLTLANVRVSYGWQAMRRLSTIAREHFRRAKVDLSVLRGSHSLRQRQ